MREVRAVVELLRHGEPVGGHRVRGSVDDPLSELGWEQMQQAVGDCRPWSRIITSPLRRCAAFAEHVAQRHDTPLRIDSSLAEIDFGDWEGQRPQALWSQAPAQVRGFFADPLANPPPGGEPFADFQVRVMDAWEHIVREAEGRWLIVAHGGTIRVILASVLQIPPQKMFSLEVGYACLSQLAIYADAEDSRRVVLRTHA